MAIAKIRDIMELMERWYPLGWAEDWDNVGLMLGDPDTSVKRILVALDATLCTAREAKSLDAQLIVSHHPLIFKPLRSLRADRAEQHVLWALAQMGIAVYSAHTNLDIAPNGVNDALAEALDLKDCEILERNHKKMLKLTAFVPEEAFAAVADAVFAAGAGRYENYDECGFSLQGIGSFRPLAGSSPTLGEIGFRTRTDEVRFEAIVDASLSGAVTSALLKAHPYEVPAFDLTPLEAPEADGGMGRIGVLPGKMSIQEFSHYVSAKLKTCGVRVCGPVTKGKMVYKVAVCGGSGASTMRTACAMGAQVLVTGDVDHHEALEAEARGIYLIDAGHGPTERVVLPRLVDRLQKAANALQWDLEVFMSTDEQDPWRRIQG